MGRADSRRATGCAWSSPARRRRRGRSSGIETELGWEFVQIYGLTETSPLLTMNRAPCGVRRTRRRASGPRGSARAGAPAFGVRLQVDDHGEVLASSNVVLEGYWEQPEATAGGDRRRLVPHRRRRHDRRRALPHDLRPQEGRDHLRWRERVVDRGGGRLVPPPRRRRGLRSSASPTRSGARR